MNVIVLVDHYARQDKEDGITAIIETELSAEELQDKIIEMKNESDDYDIFTLENLLDQLGCKFYINPDVVKW